VANFLQTQLLADLVTGVAVVLMLFFTAPANAGVCRAQDAKAADAMVDHIDSWTKLSMVYAKYKSCDLGEIAEGNSEAIARLLVDHWNTLPQLGKLIARNPRLKAYVLRHIDSTLDGADLTRIKRLASSSCLRDITSLCAALAAAAARAPDGAR
jgi:hypothetical protein